jgi:hypothetical protein
VSATAAKSLFASAPTESLAKRCKIARPRTRRQGARKLFRVGNGRMDEPGMLSSQDKKMKTKQLNTSIDFKVSDVKIGLGDVFDVLL